MTPLAHTGVWRNVSKAPYDHIIAAIGQRDFVRNLPNGERDYWKACRAYCDVLYKSHLSISRKRICLDKTPEYATIWPFITRVFPDAKYIVLTRHPLAIFCSFANSFFDGDYRITQQHDPLLKRYVPSIAALLRQVDVSLIHVKYEDLVVEPESWMRRIYEYIGIPFEPGSINYGCFSPASLVRQGLGDPIEVEKYTRPSAMSINKWAVELAADPDKLAFMRKLVDELDPDDLRTIGYPLESFWKPLESVNSQSIQKKNRKLTGYWLQRKAIVRMRYQVQRSAVLRRFVDKLKTACEVLLREY